MHKVAYKYNIMIPIFLEDHLGLGDAIAVASMLANLNADVEVTSRTSDCILFDIFHVFGTPKNVKINHANYPNVLYDSMTEVSKFVSPYLDITEFDFLGSKKKINISKNKKIIALVQYYGSAKYVRYDPNHVTHQYPYNKYYSLDEFAGLFSLAASAGYDIITMNHKLFSLSETANFLSENVACLIGYEGGLTHLCHVLKIPTIVLPWRCGRDGQDYSLSFDNRMQNIVGILHLDKKTYIPESINEVLSWGNDQFKTIIENLQNNNGNNSYITDYNISKDHEKKELVVTHKTNCNINVLRIKDNFSTSAKSCQFKEYMSIHMSLAEFQLIHNYMPVPIFLGGFSNN